MSIFLGGTGSANELHDYEEGNWTPTIYQGGWTISNTNAAKYTKIGKVVTIWLYMTVTGTGNGDNIIIPTGNEVFKNEEEHLDIQLRKDIFTYTVIMGVEKQLF